MPTSRTGLAITLIALIFAPLPLHAQDSTAVTALAGTWVGDVTHRGQHSTVAFAFTPTSDGTLDVQLFLPVIHVRDIPIGRVTRAGTSIQAGPFALTWDSAAGALSGVMPRAIVPVHSMPITLHRGAIPTFPTRPEALPAAQPVWTFDTRSPIWGDLEAAGSLVYVGADDGRLHALDVRTGTERWTFQADGAIRARPAVHGAALYLHADDGVLYRLDASTGEERWRVRTTAEPVTRVPPPDPNSRWDSRGSAVATADGRLFVGTHDGRVLALDSASGARLWMFAAGGSILATPAALDGRVFAGSFDGRIYTLDAASGALLWTYDTGAPVTSTPVPVGDMVVAGSRSYDLFGLEASSGAVRWNRYVWFSWIESTPAVRDGVAYVGSSDAAKIMAFEVTTGRVLWDSDVLGASWGTPAVSDRVVFVGVRGQANAAHAPGALALERATGRIVWRFPVPSPAGAAFSGFAASPAMTAGRVIFGAVDGRVFAFDGRTR
jgi:outer membrane protein assembly factor BamB